MLNCEIIRDLLPQYGGGTLSSASTAAIEEHTLTCPVCAKLLEDKSVQVRKAKTHSLRQNRLRRWLPISALGLILLLAAVLLLSKLLPDPAISGWQRIDCAGTDWSAKIQQQGDSFTLRILIENTQIKQLSLEGVYQSALWASDGAYLAVGYTKSDHTCVCIYNTANGTTRQLDEAFTTALRYQHSAFSFLSGQTSQHEGMHYIPWVWDHLNYSLLVYGKGTASDGWSYQGYFWYDPFEGTIGGVTGFDHKFLDIPDSPTPLPSSNPNAR